MKLPNGARSDWAIQALSLDSEECLLAPFTPGSHGYVGFMLDGRQLLMHRFICGKIYGPPPTPRHQVAHSCGHKTCANWRHLRWATRKENEADKLTHGTRTRGERHGSSKLSSADVLAIREARGSQREIGKTFNVSQQTVADIKTRRRWAWL